MSSAQANPDATEGESEKGTFKRVIRSGPLKVTDIPTYMIEYLLASGVSIVSSVYKYKLIYQIDLRRMEVEDGTRPCCRFLHDQAAETWRKTVFIGSFSAAEISWKAGTCRAGFDLYLQQVDHILQFLQEGHC